MGVEEFEVLDLRKEDIFKKHGAFLEAMYHFNNSTLKELSKKSNIQYKYLFNIVNFFEERGIVEKYTKSGCIRPVYVCLTKKGYDLVNALVDFTYIMKHGERLKEGHLGGEGIIVIPINDLRKDVYGRKRKRSNKRTRK